ncbi:MAG: hypothetical protein AB7K24_34925 [Gemmataceae bacterium]
MFQKLIACLTVGLLATAAAGQEPLRIATFNVPATPRLGSPVAYAPARKIEDPLSARGIILLSNQKPVVLCAVDWIGIGNGGHDLWREKLARAAGTTIDRVAVHTLHQHDAPRCDFSAEAILAERRLSMKHFDTPFARETIERTAQAIKAALEKPRTISHLGVGQANVEKVASNRRILGPDGKVKLVRWSKSTDPEAIAAPEGVIDPALRLLSFWAGDEPVAVLTYYATHPQSYYGQGDVTAEFVGLARARRESELKVLHIHFNGASGNVAAGKYNDGSEKARVVLTDRLADGMKRAWAATKKLSITAEDLDWRVVAVKLPAGKHLDEAKLKAIVEDNQQEAKARLKAATQLAFLTRAKAGKTIDVCLLRLKNVYVLHLPGELFVEYQLAAQALRPEETVCMAAYGDYGPGYIGTAIAYTQGGYETGPGASNVAPEVEEVLMSAIKKLLAKE